MPHEDPLAWPLHGGVPVGAAGLAWGGGAEVQGAQEHVWRGGEGGGRQGKGKVEGLLRRPMPQSFLTDMTMDSPASSARGNLVSLLRSMTALSLAALQVLLATTLAPLTSRLSQVAAVPRNADFFIKCASEVRKLKFRDIKT